MSTDRERAEALMGKTPDDGIPVMRVVRSDDIEALIRAAREEGAREERERLADIVDSGRLPGRLVSAEWIRQQTPEEPS